MANCDSVLAVIMKNWLGFMGYHPLRASKILHGDSGIRTVPHSFSYLASSTLTNLLPLKTPCKVYRHSVYSSLIFNGRNMQIISLLEVIEKERAIFAGLRNAAHAATKDVPNEILLKIFSFLCPPMAISKRNSRSSDAKDHSTADLRRVTQVCSAWRFLALASPGLWTVLNFNDEALAWLKELLRRCGSFPIHITADSSPFNFFRIRFKAQGMIEKFEMISTSSPTIGSISVVYDKLSPLLVVIENFISQKCISTTRLSISTTPGFRIWRGWQTDGNLLPRLDKSHNLRQLEVSGYRPDLTLSSFRQLASLSVSCLIGITANEWGRALSGLPELIHLRLEYAISSNIGFQAESIKIPCLKTLALIGEFDDGIGDFLLAIEATKKFSLFLHCTIDKNTILDQLLQGLRKWFAIWNINLHPDVGRRRVDVMSSFARFRLHNQIPGNELSDEWFRVFLNWRRIPNVHCIRKLQADILQVFGPVLRQTRTLSICAGGLDEGFICSPGFWQEYFHRVRTLRFLKVACGGDVGNTGCFINALCNDIGVSPFYDYNSRISSFMLASISRTIDEHQATTTASCVII